MRRRPGQDRYRLGRSMIRHAGEVAGAGPSGVSTVREAGRDATAEEIRDTHAATVVTLSGPPRGPVQAPPMPAACHPSENQSPRRVSGAAGGRVRAIGEGSRSRPSGHRQQAGAGGRS